MSRFSLSPILSSPVLVIILLAAFAHTSCAKGPGPRPLQELEPTKATFSLELTTSEGKDWSGTLREEEVNENVVPAREAIRTMVAEGYRYVQYGGDARYGIKLDLVCYDPLTAKKVYSENRLVDETYPLIYGPMDQSGSAVVRAEVDQDFYQWPHPSAQAPRSCSGKVVMVVTERGGDKPETFKGVVPVSGCPYDGGCAYRQCADQLREAMVRFLQHRF